MNCERMKSLRRVWWLSAIACLCVAPAWAEDAKDAVAIDASYCIVVPTDGQGGVVRALRQAGKELADAFNEGAGVKLKVVGDNVKRTCVHKGSSKRQQWLMGAMVVGIRGSKKDWAQ